MAVFKYALERTLKLEGGYSNYKNDVGGETIFGIARNKNPDWKGWALVDNIKQFCTEQEGTEEWGQELTDNCRQNADITRLKSEFYQNHFWDKAQLSKVENQQIAETIFDACVNHGVAGGIKIAQRILGLEIDGIMGEKTLKAINGLFGKQIFSFLENFVYRRIEVYERIVQKNPNLAVFLDGWRSRARRFYP